MDFRAIIFVPALVGSVIFGFVFALFAAHYYLTVLQSTASGSRQVVWVSEPILDNFWKVFYLAWLIGLWLGPAWFLGRAFAAGTDSVWLKLAVPLAVFWVCYPVSQMSSLSGPTIWLPLVPDVFGRLAAKPRVLLGFMALSGVTLAGFGLAYHWTFFADGVVWLFVGSPLLVATGLLYARLIGRLAFVLMFTRSLLARRKKKKKPKADAAGNEPLSLDDAERPAEDEPGFAQPSELPPIETPDEGPLTGYDVKFADEPPRKRVRAEAADQEPTRKLKRRRDADEEDEDNPYGVHEPEVQPEERAPPVVVQPSADEMRLISRDDVPRKPKQAWTADVFLFLLHPGTISVVVILSAMCIAAGGMVRIARAFNPAAGD